MGAVLVECFSQNKDELVLGFSGKADFWIKADLSNQQGLLSFPDDFKRARRNSINLFTETTGLEVIGIKTHENERSFEIKFKDNRILVFKLFGKWSNILLYANDSLSNLFKKSLANDNNLLLTAFDRQIDQSRAAFDKANGNIKQLFPTFGKLIATWLIDNNYEHLNLDEKWNLIQDLLRKLEKPEFLLIINRDKPHLSMLPVGDTLREYSCAIQAINSFNHYLFTDYLIAKEKQQHLMVTQSNIDRSLNYIEKCEVKMNELSLRRFDQVADVIMANLHQIVMGTTEVELLNFYTNENVRIKLNNKLTPQKNAERYYQKFKNQGIEIKKLEENIKAKKQEVKQLGSNLEEIQSADNLKQIKRLSTPDKSLKSKKEANLPYHRFDVDGFAVLVGKNAKTNDRLTLDHAHKDDLWFHARDVAGSHVVLKMQSGKDFPLPLIEKTAQLAAWYSKGRNFTLCPVIYTPKKWVRKPKGFTPGMVKVEREEVILVKPQKI